MSVIIRLQNLPWTANARDIRNFFSGLSIPEGGVHIIGGEMGDAFIAFSTDEDARCAMLKDREKLMEIQVRLLLSSRAEMQKVIETARKVATAAAAPIAVPVPIPVAATRPAPAAANAPMPPVIGGLGGFLGQVKAAVPVNAASAGAPSFLAYQQQAGITLSEVTGRGRSRSRSRSSSSDDSDREREWERERNHRDRGRKRRTDRKDSQERELKSAHIRDGVVPSPWAQAPPQVQLTQGLGVGLSLAAAPIMPSLQNYTTSTSSTTNNITNHYNLSTNASTNPQLMAALQQVANGGQTQVMEQQPAKSTEPIAFASVNPYAQMYPQLFQQQQLLLQQQTPAKVSPLGLGSSPVAGGGGGGGTGVGTVCGGNTPVPVADTCYIRMSGLCPSISYSEIRKYFQGLYIPHNGIKIMTVNGNRNGIAYVEFSRVSSAQKAVQRNNTMFRDRMIQISPVGDDEFERAEERANQQRNHHDGGGGRSHHHNGGGGERNTERGGGGMPMPIPVTTVLYIEDLPQLTTEQEIMKMFSSNYTVVDIQLSPSPNNRRECVAFVLFARQSDAKSALEDTSCHYIGFRQLRVRPSSLQEMQNAKEKLRRANEQLLKEEADQREELLQDQQRRQQQEQEQENQRFANDPRRRQAEEMQQQQHHQQQQQQMNMNPSMMSPFANGNMPFNMPPMQQQQQQMPNFPFGMNNGMAMNMNCNGNSNGNGPNFPNIGPERSESGGGDGQRPRQEDVFVRVHNCEYATRANDLGELFSLEQLRIEHIEQLFNDRNQSSGEFIVEFSDPASTKQAVREFHNRRFRGRGLRVVTITPQEIADRMNKPFMDYLPGGNGPRQQQQPPESKNPIGGSGGSGGSGTGSRGGGSSEGQGNKQSRRRGPSRFNDINSPPQDQPPQQQQLEKPRSQEREKSQESNGSSTTSTTTTTGKQHFNPFARPDPPMIGSTSLSLSPKAAPAAASPVIMTEISDKFNRPGCVVAMRNVPFKAELKDILRFFGDYKLSPDDIIRRFNDDGKPTGDTRVAFESPAEARSAFESRRRKQIFNRTVYLDII